MEYSELVQKNEFAFREMVRTVRPDIYVLMDLLDTTGVNYLTLFHVIRHIANIADGTKFGTISIEIQNGIVTFVRGEESSRLNEPALLQKNTD